MSGDEMDGIGNWNADEERLQKEMQKKEGWLLTRLATVFCFTGL